MEQCQEGENGGMETNFLPAGSAGNNKDLNTEVVKP